MNEKRRLTRKRPDVNLRVTDAMSGDVVGHLGNLSMQGMMLIAHAPIVEDGLYQFDFHLPRRTTGLGRILFLSLLQTNLLCVHIPSRWS